MSLGAGFIGHNLAIYKIEDTTAKPKNMFTYSVKYTSGLIIPAAVSVMSRDLIFLVYGASYNHAPTYLTLYAAIFLFAAAGSTVLGSFFSGIGESKVTLRQPDRQVPGLGAPYSDNTCYSHLNFLQLMDSHL